MWEKSGGLTPLTRETEGNQIPPLISSSSLFLAAFSHNLYLDFFGRIPASINCVGALQLEHT